MMEEDKSSNLDEEYSNTSNDNSELIDVTGDEEISTRLILKNVGQSKELKDIIPLISANQSKEIEMNTEIEQLCDSLAAIGCLSSSLHRGSIDSGLCWQNGRLLGLVKDGTSSGLSIGNTMAPSAARMRRKKLSRFRLLWKSTGHMGGCPVYNIAFDKTGRFVITGADDYLVKIWDIENGILVKTCRGHEGEITLLQVSPDNSLVASACTQGFIRVWRLSDGQCIHVMKHGSCGINWIKFDETTGALASAGDDGYCIVWDLSKLLPLGAGDIPLLDLLVEQRDENFSCSSPPVAVNKNNLINNNNSDVFMVNSSSSSSSSSSFQTSHIQIDSIPLPETLSTTIVQSRGGGLETTRGSYFDWSKNRARSNLQIESLNSNSPTALLSFSDSRLMLPHITDGNRSLDRSLENNKTLQVSCLDISPVGSVLVTGCDDGNARVWRFGDLNTGNDIGVRTSGRFKENSQGDAISKKQLLEALRDVLSPTEFERMEQVGNHMLLKLEGHTKKITDVRFSNSGDRLVSASFDDGTVRIWSFSRDYSQVEQIVLAMNDDDESIQSRSGRRGGRAGLRSTSNVYNVVWTMDDLKIITLQSVPGLAAEKKTQPTRLKVWDSITGDLLRVIATVCETDCNIVCSHPTDSNIALTCGADGFVFLWDIEHEEKLCSISMPSEYKQVSDLSIYIYIFIIFFILILLLIIILFFILILYY
jgi:WD40 repeat protein